MGTKNRLSVLVLCIVFALTAALAHGFIKPTQIRPKPPLSQFFAQIDGYEILSHPVMDDKSINMLQLDDYIFTNYRGGDGVVNLYIGYYYSSDKAYAAHSPLVCYPSQGWQIDVQPTTRTLTVGPHTIEYDEIVTSHGLERELVLYWYQARMLTNTKVYRNKIAMGYNKMMHNDEQHGFVRVSVSLREGAYETAKKAATDFIAAFYPQLIEYVSEGI
jgi:EpsI family protein